jgi:hypothetical protein
MYMDAAGHHFTECKEQVTCDAGELYIDSKVAEAECKECGFGSYQTELSHRIENCEIDSKFCTKGEWVTQLNKTKERTCQLCKNGYYQDKDKHAAEKCEIHFKLCTFGEWISEKKTTVAQTCNPCPDDKYMDLDNHQDEWCYAHTAQCGRGQSISVANTTHEQECFYCPEGEYQDESTHTQDWCYKHITTCNTGEKISVMNTTHDQECLKCPEPPAGSLYNPQSLHKVTECKLVEILQVCKNPTDFDQKITDKLAFADAVTAEIGEDAQVTSARKSLEKGYAALCDCLTQATDAASCDEEKNTLEEALGGFDNIVTSTTFSSTITTITTATAGVTDDVPVGSVNLTSDDFVTVVDTATEKDVVTIATTLKTVELGDDIELDSDDVVLAAISEDDRALSQSIQDATTAEKAAAVKELVESKGKGKASALLSKELFNAVTSASKATPPDTRFASDVRKLFADCNTQDSCAINQLTANALSALKCHGGLDNTAKDRLFELELAVTDGLEVRACEQLVRLELALEYSEFDEVDRVLEEVHKPAVDATCGDGHSVTLDGYFATEFIQVGRARRTAGRVIFVLIHANDESAAITRKNKKSLKSELTTRYNEYLLQTAPNKGGGGDDDSGTIIAIVVVIILLLMIAVGIAVFMKRDHGDDRGASAMKAYENPSYGEVSDKPVSTTYDEVSTGDGTIAGASNPMYDKGAVGVAGASNPTYGEAVVTTDSGGTLRRNFKMVPGEEMTGAVLATDTHVDAPASGTAPSAVSYSIPMDNTSSADGAYDVVNNGALYAPGVVPVDGAYMDPNYTEAVRNQQGETYLDISRTQNV